jgi:hypothetical protein
MDWTSPWLIAAMAGAGRDEQVIAAWTTFTQYG